MGERLPLHAVPLEGGVAGIPGGRDSDEGLKGRAEGAEALEPHLEADVGDGAALSEALLRVLDPHPLPVLLGRGAVHALEEAQEVVAGVVRLAGDAGKVDLLGVVGVDIELCPHHLAVDVGSRILFPAHGGLNTPDEEVGRANA